MRSSRGAQVYIKRHTSGNKFRSGTCQASNLGRGTAHVESKAAAHLVKSDCCVEPTDPCILGFTAACWTLWTLYVFSKSYSVGNWSRLGDSCLGCWRNDTWTDVISTTAVALLLAAHLTCFRHRNLEDNNKFTLSPRCWGMLSSRPCNKTRSRAARLSSTVAKNALVLFMALCTSIHCSIEATRLLRVQNFVGLRPCPYQLQKFTRRQQASIGLDPQRIYLLSHLSGSSSGNAQARQENARLYAMRQGYSFTTTEELFGSYQYSYWLNQTTMQPRSASWRNSERTQDHSQVVSLYHVLFEAELNPVPEWVVWIDERVEISNRAVSLESVIFGLCSRISEAGALDFDHSARLWCKHERAWSSNTHSDAMKSILGQKVPQHVIDNVPDVVAVGAGSSEVHRFGTHFILLRNSDWVRDSLFDIFFNSNNGISDNHAFNAFFNFQSKSDKVKVLPGCMGLLGEEHTMGQHRFQYGDFARIAA